MRPNRLLTQSLKYYWRSHVAVVFGVATAVSVLAGALLVGDSVRGSLRDLVLGRLGRADHVVASGGFFRESLAATLQADVAFGKTYEAVVPLIVAPGFVTGQESGRRVGGVRVYGVDDRFWAFHGVAGTSGPSGREALVSPALARELGIAEGDSILVRVQRPTDVPLESVFGRKDDLGRTLRLTVRRVQPASSLGEFSLEPSQGDVRAVFVPLARVQQELGAISRVNTLLVAARSGVALELSTGVADGQASGPGGTLALLGGALRRHANIEDLGWHVSPLASGTGFTVGADAGVLDDAHAAAAMKAAGALSRRPMFTYLANTLRVREREVPYSLVTAVDLATTGPREAAGSVAIDTPPTADTGPPIFLNEWAAADLGARVGDPLSMDYFVWAEPGQLATRTTEFRVAGILPLAAGDREMAPAYPGISDAPTLDEWDPPFPVDLRRVRPVDEAYWERYRTTPKAFVPLEVGQRLWRTKYGALTSIRLTSASSTRAGESGGAAPAEAASVEAASKAFVERLRSGIDPLALGLAVRDVRAEGLLASRGATDFGEYFLYFSFFLVVSALLLSVLFFTLGVEQRAREVGLLRAVGFGPAVVRRLFLGEGVVLAVVGSALGTIGALAYAGLVMAALRTWWFDAVGTTALTLHVSSSSLVSGAVGGVLAAVACIWWTLRSLARVSERALLAGQVSLDDPRPAKERGKRLPAAAAALAVIAMLLLAGTATGRIEPAGGFFGAGAVLLVGALVSARAVLVREPRRADGLGGRWPLLRLGMRNASHRPGRSLLAIAVIACATFIIVSVDAFRRGGQADTGRQSGVGGYGLLVETLLPVAHDPNSSEGREALNLFNLDGGGAGSAASGGADRGTRIEPFRLRPGDDASCLNLYEPRNPRILAPRDSFLDEGRFAFGSSLATTAEDIANPWRLLRRVEPDGAIPVIADANSMTYVLHRALGEDLVLTVGGRDVRLRFVAALQDSLFQGELLMAPANFVRLFPDHEGTRVFLVESRREPAQLASTFEEAWVDLGGDAIPTVERLAQFHRVENTYLSTFQTLGGLGLLLGTIGLATVLLRNVLERRKELALLGAVGYRSQHVRQMVLAENALLLLSGLVIGTLCAGLAILPAVAARGGRVPLTSGAALLLFGVFLTGLLSSVVALRAATRTPLLAALRSE